MIVSYQISSYCSSLLKCVDINMSVHKIYIEKSNIMN